MNENLTDQEIIEDVAHRISLGAFDIKDADYLLIQRMYRISADRAKRLVPLIKSEIKKVD